MPGKNRTRKTNQPASADAAAAGTRAGWCMPAACVPAVVDSCGGGREDGGEWGSAGGSAGARCTACLLHTPVIPPSPCCGGGLLFTVPPSLRTSPSPSFCLASLHTACPACFV